MTNPNWKPQPGKPAMTRAVKILVTDLVRLGADAVWSKQRQHSWTKRGFSFSGDDGFDLVEPTAAILAAHGIDADGKPVAKAAWDTRGENSAAAENEPRFHADQTNKMLFPAPAPSTRVDDRWFQAACAALNGLTAVSYDRQEEAPIGHVRLAAEMADALMAEVAKREGR